MTNVSNPALFSSFPSVSTNGTLTYTPATNATGTSTFTLDVQDNGGTANGGQDTSAPQTFTVTVGQAPAITSADAATFTAGIANTFMIVATSSPAADLSETGLLPTGVSFVNNNDGTATLSGTPATGTVGVYVLGLKAKNGTKPNGTQTFTLTIGQAPTITSKQSVAVTVGSAVNFPITTTGFPIAAISETGVLPAGLTFTDKGTGIARLHGTPSVGTSGTYPITIIAKNGAKPNGKQSLRIVVNDPVVRLQPCRRSAGSAPLQAANQRSTLSF